jgi:hypothetical protein
VQVLQVFRTTSPTILSPTLPPCIVGVCNQIVDAVTKSSTGASLINSEALVALPGYFLALAAPGSPAAYTSLDGKQLVLSIKGGPEVTVAFAGTSLSPKKVVSEILDAFATAGVTEALAEVVGDTFALRTIGTGEFETIEVVVDYPSTKTDPEVLAAFGVGANRVYRGESAYEQFLTDVSLTAFPDTRGNLNEVTIDPASLKVYLSLGGSSLNFKELSRTSSFLRRGAVNTVASLTGSVILSGLTYGVSGALNGLDINVLYDGNTYAVSFDSAVADASGVVARINGILGVAATSLDTSGHLKWTSQLRGAASQVKLVSGTALTTLGFTAGDISTGTSAVSAVDDGNGDGVTPILELAEAMLTTAATAANVIGWATPTTVTDGHTLILGDGFREQTHTFDSAASLVDIIAHLEDEFGEAAGGRLAFSNSSSSLKIENTFLGDESVVRVVGGTALYELGLTPQLLGTADLDAVVDAAATFNTKTLILDINGTEYTTTFAGLVALSDGAAIAAKVHAEVSAVAAAGVNAAKHLYVRSLTGGTNTSITVVGGTAVTDLGLTVGAVFSTPGVTATNQYVRGLPYPPKSGDELYVDGSYYARIVQVAPGANAARVKIDKQVAINAGVGLSWYIIAKNLPATAGPDPDLIVNGDGSFRIKHEVLRDTQGAPSSTGRGSIYVSYSGLRKDVTALATNPSLIRLNDTTQLTSLLSPVDARNPLALGLYFALINAPTTQVTGIGVDAYSADSPYGTVEAFTRAAEFLEGVEVYAIAPLTQDTTVAQVYREHVLAMSEPEQRGERIVIVNTPTPTHKPDTLVAAGAGNSTSATQLETGIANLSELLLNAGIDPSGTIPAADGVFLDIASDAKHYSISSISGSLVNIRTAFTAGQNDDSFYSTTDLNDSPLPAQLINENFVIKLRGESLTLTDGRLDKNAAADAIATISASYATRRLWNTFPGTCTATIGGIDTVLPGFYMSAAIAGMVGRQAPSQSFTNVPMTGFTGVVGSNNFFSEKQLDRIAGGGTWVIIQEGAGTALFARMALTSDVSTIEFRTDSITKVVDYTAKFLRRGLRTYIGRFNITSGFLDSLSHITQGLLAFLVDTGTLLSGDLSNITQDESQIDTVLIDTIIAPPVPCNFIKLSLVI